MLLEVTDEGDGFGAELGERAFDRFARGDRARTRRGAGLGLAIVKTIVEARGGSATVRSDAPTATVQLRLMRGR